MTRRDASGDQPPREEGGATTGVGGTPFAVDLSPDRRARIIWVVFLAGPVIWFTHFMLVYMVVEAGCTGEGRGLVVFNPPVPTIVTLVATGVAAAACLWCAGWAYRRWRNSTQDSVADDPNELVGDMEGADRDGALAFTGFLLSVLSFMSVLLVGLPALVLPAC